MIGSLLLLLPLLLLVVLGTVLHHLLAVLIVAGVLQLGGRDVVRVALLGHSHLHLHDDV